MNARILVPMFAALILTGTARSQNPGPPPQGGPPPGGPMADHLKHRIEELRREGKNDMAERMERHAKEMWAQHRGSPGGERRDEKHGAPASGNPSERRGHLAEAARHLHAAGINVSPEQLERLSQKFHGKMEPRRPGSPGNAAPGREHAFRPPMGGPAPGAPSGPDDIRNQIRALANQVQELRNMIQGQRGGQPQVGRRGEANRGEQGSSGHHERGAQPSRDGEHRGDKPRVEQHKDHPVAPAAGREHRDGPPGERREGNLPPQGERPRNNPPGPPPAP